MDLTSDQILRLGRKYLRELEALRDKLAKEIDTNMDPDSIISVIKDRHPKDFKELLEKYREAVEEAKSFVLKSDFATVPKNEKLIVVETPPYLKHLYPFAIYFPPAKFDPVKTGVYMVTPPETKEMLREHSFPSIENRTVHEATLDITFR